MSRKRVKQYLTLLMAIGVIAVVAGGSGTFASFTAEVTHTGNTFATGTLLLHSTSGTTTCASGDRQREQRLTTGCTVLHTSDRDPGSGRCTPAMPCERDHEHRGHSLAQTSSGRSIKLRHRHDTFTATTAVTAGSTVTIPVISKAPANAYAAATASPSRRTRATRRSAHERGTLDATDIKFAIPSCTNSATQTLTLGTTTVHRGARRSRTLRRLGLRRRQRRHDLDHGRSTDTRLHAGAAVNAATRRRVTTNAAHHATSATVTYEPFGYGTGTCARTSTTRSWRRTRFHHDSTQRLLCVRATRLAIGCTFSSGTSYAEPPTDADDCTRRRGQQQHRQRARRRRQPVLRDRRSRRMSTRPTTPTRTRRPTFVRHVAHRPEVADVTRG